LEIYLNVVEWGEGIYGVEAASQAYFGKSASDLDWDEAIALAAVLPSPRRHTPCDGSKWTASRSMTVRQRLLTAYRETAGREGQWKEQPTSNEKFSANNINR
jgi:membrane peptidoglycan carboxypeptidase